ncbi:hypothetical protein TKK_0017131 [Trichogramma kaykai]|uniref:Uncharacterized protein n=1 Tax=Trichogramma kaykai TaxID=54128 RepID=A0ABD2W5N0_9HYME
MSDNKSNGQGTMAEKKVDAQGDVDNVEVPEIIGQESPNDDVSDQADGEVAESHAATNKGGVKAEETGNVEAVSQAFVQLGIKQEPGADSDIAEAWTEVEKKLVSARARYLDVRAEEKNALAEFDNFLQRYGEEGLKLAGEWSWKMDSYKQERDAAWRVIVRRREERETRESQIAELKRKQIRAEQAKKKLEETSAKARAALLAATRAYEDSLKEVSFAEVATRKPTHSLHGNLYVCSVCGCLGVRRAAECPRKEVHYFEPQRKREVAAGGPTGPKKEKREKEEEEE